MIVARWACDGEMEERIVFRLGGSSVTVIGIKRTMPMVLPFRRAFLEDILAVGTENVITETEVLV